MRLILQLQPQHHARAPLPPASGFLHFCLVLAGGGCLLWGTALTTVFPCSAKCADSFLGPVWVWGTRLGHRPAGAGLCPGHTGHHLSHCAGESSVSGPDQSPPSGRNPWPTITSYLPRLCVSAVERTMGSWTSFQPEMPTIL